MTLIELIAMLRTHEEVRFAGPGATRVVVFGASLRDGQMDRSEFEFSDELLFLGQCSGETRDRANAVLDRDLNATLRAARDEVEPGQAGPGHNDGAKVES